MSKQTVQGQIGNREYKLETGWIAKQAHGSVLMQCGGTVVLAAVVAAKENTTRDFFPLTVDYRERAYAAGKIPGGYFKREGKQSDNETLISRLIDRPIRPLFHEDYMRETQITVTALSVDHENQPDILAMNAASAALMISNIPFMTPLGSVRIGLVDGEYVVNPSILELEKSELDLVLAGSEEKIIMIEAGCSQISEEKMLEAIEFGHKEIRKFLALQKELQKKAGVPKLKLEKIDFAQSIKDKVASMTKGQFEKIFGIKQKEEREGKAYELLKSIIESLKEDPDFNESKIKLCFDHAESVALRAHVLENGLRPDGRKFDEIRQITCEIGILPRTHGTSLFTRGQTQSLSVATLGTGDDEQMIDTLAGRISKRFMLHYNFPPYSVGEVGPNRGPGRREIGHGALAERALESIIPSGDDFPYTIRLVSEIMESNGSSSMATVCGGTLALMDAGIPIKAPVAGIAMGLVTKGSKWQVLTDIAGVEDHHGDMDFKAAGTKDGLTALQMDLKIDGVTHEMLKEFFKQAKSARMKIMDKMLAVISEPRPELSEFAPRITTIRINPEKIGELIGPGGKNIRKIVEETGAKIDIEDDGRVFVASSDSKAAQAAIDRIQGISQEAELGKVYEGKVRKLMNFGAFCEILPGRDGLLHVSEIAEGFVKTPTDYLRVGDIVPVKVTNIDDNGKISLSIKQAKEGGWPMLPPDAERDVIEPPRERGDRDRGGRSRSRR